MVSYKYLTMQIDTANWGGKPFDEYARWEQREILSYSDIDNSPNFELVNKIAANKITTWANLTLEDEALVQKLLRNRGIDLICYDLNQFPTTLESLQSHTTTLPTEQKLKIKYFQTMKYVNELINSIPLQLVCVIAGLLYFQFDLIGYALIEAYIVCNCLVVVGHMGWSHRYVTPKNKLISMILSLIGVVFWHETTKSARLHWTCRHLYHHKEWRKEEDDVQGNLAENHWLVYLFLNMKINNKNNKLAESFVADLNPTYLKSLDKFSLFIENNYTKVFLTLHIILLALLGLKYYFFFVFLQIWINKIYSLFFGEIVAHPGSATRQTEKDHPKLFLICPEYAYHASHHRKNALILGPRLLKYINIQYYFIRLFYNIQTNNIV